ncbi:hypothetical protein GCM10010278_05610 [Streptomyces melanogenes]|nr:hypothetical protein GCM10010278_05610 [Streptomyces melanogenes]
MSALPEEPTAYDTEHGGPNNDPHGKGTRYMDDDRFVVVAEGALEVDEQEADRAGFLTAEERELTLRGHGNRVGIAVREPERVVSSDAGPGRVAYDVGLMLIVHAHPECRFVWSRLVVDLTATPGAVIEDMAPSEVEETPVEVETTVGAGLTFSTAVVPVDVELRPELTRRRTVHFPTLTASGTGFHKAYWDFQATDDSYLHTNRELRLLISAPAGAPVTASFQVRARLRLRGARNLVAFRAKKGSLDTRITLVPAREGEGAGAE